MTDAAPTAAPPQDYDPLAAEPGYPFQQLLGFEVVEWRRDFARVEMPLDERHANRQGLPHGGVHAAIMDAAMGFAGSWCPYPGRVRRVMTLSLTVNYLGRPKGRRLIAEARVTGGGRKSFFAEASVVDELGTLVATGSGALRFRGNSGEIEGDPL